MLFLFGVVIFSITKPRLKMIVVTIVLLGARVIKGKWTVLTLRRGVYHLYNFVRSHKTVIMTFYSFS
jgi:hypothetical protein